jgi:DNA polymerase delta subunit 4
MSRLERWERAASFGLNPPDEVCPCTPSRTNINTLLLLDQVRHILLTREGVDKDEYSQCVLYGEV